MTCPTTGYRDEYEEPELIEEPEEDEPTAAWLEQMEAEAEADRRVTDDIETWDDQEAA